VGEGHERIRGSGVTSRTQELKKSYKTNVAPTVLYIEASNTNASKEIVSTVEVLPRLILLPWAPLDLGIETC